MKKVVLIVPTIFRNLGDTDRLIRLVGGLVLVMLPLFIALPVLWQVIVWVAAVEMLLTAATGY